MIIKNKFLVLILILACAGLFLAFRSHTNVTDENPRAKNEKTLHNVGLLLEQGHYSPRKINDDFSKDVFKVFLKNLDDDKSFFLQSDIDGFAKYENSIDDEIHGTKKIESFYAINDVYTKRLNEVSLMIDPLLAKPFDFTKDENIVLDGDKNVYPKTEADRKEIWRKRLKYMVLTKYVDLISSREKNKLKISTKTGLPAIDVKTVLDKTTISWTNNYKDKIDKIDIQQAADSAKDFKTIASASNPNGKINSYLTKSASKNNYYRAVIYFKNGTIVNSDSLKSSSPQDDVSLEKEARELTRKQINRYFSTLKNHNTTDAVFSEFVNAITNTMDPHTDYFAPVDQRMFSETMSGTFFGIGAQLKEEESKITIASLITGGPAWKSGEIHVGDEIIKIGEGTKEPVDVTGYAVSDAVKLIRGAEKGTEVRLTLRKIDGATKVVILHRDEIKTDDTFAKSAIINGTHKIGYIYLPVFYMDFDNPNGARCSDDVAKEIEKLKAEKVDGIIMDLRDNGGGSLPEVVKMAGLFIQDGPICQVKGRDEKPYVWKDRDKTIQYAGPLTVMVDENSASASEIFAAAIQDYKRGIIVGSSSTYGKGTVQRTIPLTPEGDITGKNSEDLGTVKITMQKFYRINGGATQLRGVVPDVIIPDRYEFAKTREKDNPSALGWDEIAKSDYTTFANGYNPNVIQSVTNQVNSSNLFKQMQHDLEQINIYNDKEYSLNIVKFKAEQNKLKDLYKDLDSLSKLTKELNVKGTNVDLIKTTGNKEKIEKSKQFINRIKTDIYIDETVKVMDTMIGNGAAK